MTDKQIIIDGSDVSGCLFYQVNFEEDYDVKIKHYCSNWHNSCESNNNSNCYYKQLQRKEQRIVELNKTIKAKEQECEELKKKLKPKLKNAHCAYFDGQTGWCNAKEFTRCNPIGCKLYTIDELSTIVDLQQQLDQLKAENERLKRNITEIFACLIKANRSGIITDTIWVGTIMTLWDYMALTLGIEGDQVQVEEQVLQKISEVEND